MRLLRTISENEMVAAFLTAEVRSARFGETTRQIARHLNVSPHVLTRPNLASAKENRVRAKVLDEWRGYTSRTKLFDGFPNRVRWYRATLAWSDLQNLYYGRSPKYWAPLSYGTHRVEDGVKFIYSMPKGGNPARFVRSIYRGIKAGYAFPPIIALTDLQRSKLVLIEGSARSTAHYKAMSDGLINKMDAIIGVSDKIASWDMWVPTI